MNSFLWVSSCHACASCIVLPLPAADCCPRFPWSAVAACLMLMLRCHDACVTWDAGVVGITQFRRYWWPLARVQRSTSYCHKNCGRTRLGSGSHGQEEGQRWGFRSGRRFAPCLRGGGRGKFSAGWLGTGAGCRFTSREATRHWYQAKQGKCGHTFPPPGGS